ncbi:hypothetical protein GCM10022254_04190 [Actinomadura meridiana]|uniref:Major facilitator superfamily (MFS) profile domain-containing protein n=1 Tax=Actinomadura meridiana TaxID=559626 RepID=A0ABP8BSF2_9ACTN
MTPDGTGVSAPYSRRWIALCVLLVAGFMDLLDVTIVNVTIPTILEDLDAEYAKVEWVIAGYVLGFAALLITGGRLGDTYGRKRMFQVGVTGFTVASLLCGVAPNIDFLIGARFFQGAMSGLMVPQILSIMHATFPTEERGKVLGIWGGVLGSASAAGLVAGGLLLEWNPGGLDWRSIFLVNVPIGIAALIVAWATVPESKSPSAPKLDLVGVLLSVTGILMLVYPLMEGRALGWPAWSFALMGGAAAVLAAFVLYERWHGRTKGSPVIVLSLFRARAFTAGMSVWLLFWTVLGGFFFVWTLYMQVGLGWTPLHAGLTSLAFAFGGATGAGLSVQVFTPRFGRRVLLTGALLNAIGFATYAWVIADRELTIHSWQMLVPLAVSGFGFGLVVAPMVDAILTGVPRRDAGSASGVLNTIQQVGMALGVALSGVLFFGWIDDNADHGVDETVPALRRDLTAEGLPPAAQERVVAQFRTCVRDRSGASDPTAVPASCRTGSPSGDRRLAELLTSTGEQANGHNFARGFAITVGYGAGMMLVVFAGLFAIPRRIETRDLDAEIAPSGDPVSSGSAPTPRD